MGFTMAFVCVGQPYRKHNPTRDAGHWESWVQLLIWPKPYVSKL